MMKQMQGPDNHSEEEGPTKEPSEEEVNPDTGQSVFKIMLFQVAPSHKITKKKKKGGKKKAKKKVKSISLTFRIHISHRLKSRQNRQQ